MKLAADCLIKGCLLVRVPIDVGNDAAVQWAVTGQRCLPATVYLIKTAQSSGIAGTLITADSMWSDHVCLLLKDGLTSRFVLSDPMLNSASGIMQALVAQR